MDKGYAAICEFKDPFKGECTREADDDGYCEEHGAMKCVSCGGQATRLCPFAATFVCGEPLCDDCEHGAYGSHARKSGGKASDG